MSSTRLRRGRLSWPRRAAVLGVATVSIATLLTVSNTASAAPTMVLDKYCGPDVTTITVSGGGLEPGQTFWVNARRPNGDWRVSQRGAASRTGTYSLTVPLDVSAANDGIAAPAMFFSVQAKDIIGTAWYFIGCADPLRPYPARQASTSGPMALTFSLNEFDAVQPVRISIPGVPTPPAQRPAETNEFTFAHQPPCGASTVTARQRTIDTKTPDPIVTFAPRVANRLAALAPVAAPDRVATGTIYVHCPTIAASPDSFADTDLPAPVTVRGTDWYPSKRGYPVRIMLDDAVIGQVNRGESVIDATLQLPRTSCGGHRLSAVQVVGNGERVLMVLTAETSITVKCGKAELTVNPSVTEGGRLVEAAGAKFVPGRTVKLVWVDLENRPIVDAGTVTAGADGTISFAAFLLPNSDLGPRRLHALEVPSAGDPRGAREGFADLLVVPSSMERGRTRFLERG